MDFVNKAHPKRPHSETLDVIDIDEEDPVVPGQRSKSVCPALFSPFEWFSSHMTCRNISNQIRRSMYRMHQGLDAIPTHWQHGLLSSILMRTTRRHGSVLPRVVTTGDEAMPNSVVFSSIRWAANAFEKAINPFGKRRSTHHAMGPLVRKSKGEMRWRVRVIPWPMNLRRRR